ncbi:hypothetical protein BpHYR1_001907 [Brachionus plicatilis]|uniref:Uncharacterized protein n=1 Tax=Brachionus plicatilis TaxID=10195 RepID=A0A3M7SJM5_BRAPC|nr:hypothetical protein BpHYR1_001907 [Brachionus plicatilis]
MYFSFRVYRSINCVNKNTGQPSKPRPALQGQSSENSEDFAASHFCFFCFLVTYTYLECFLFANKKKFAEKEEFAENI